MKVNVNKQPKHIREADKRIKRRIWHEAYAWTPKKVDQTDDGHSVIWFEKYMRKEQVGPASSQKGINNGCYWEQYSKKTYFKKKLNGDIKEKTSEIGDSVIIGSSSIGTVTSAPGTTLYYTGGSQSWVTASGAQTTVFKDDDVTWHVNDTQMNLDFSEEDFTVDFSFAYDGNKESSK